jgi:hypothetical protein
MAPPVAPAVVVSSTDLVGRWGLASYREDADITRTTAEAKAACGNPYVVTSGPSGGVMMHLADQASATEVVVKPAPDGRVYIGPAGKPGDRLDRLVTSYSDGVLVTKWVDPDVALRYGTMVLVRCRA